MSDTAPRTPRPWQIFVHGRENEPGPPFAIVPYATNAGEALDRIKTELNGSPADYDRDALAPELVAVRAPHTADTEQKDGNLQTAARQPVKCLKCNGTGLVRCGVLGVGRDCPDCDGTGQQT